MPSNFINSFSNVPLIPSDKTIAEFSLTDTNKVIQLVWNGPFNTSGNLIASNNHVTTTVTNDEGIIILPDATQVSNGQTIIFYNDSPNTTVQLQDNTNVVLANIEGGLPLVLQLRDNSTKAGEWYLVILGVTSASINPSDIAGNGLTEKGSRLYVSIPSQKISADTSAGPLDMGTLYVNNSANSPVTLQLPAYGDEKEGILVTLGYWVAVSNPASTTLFVEPAGGDTINGNTGPLSFSTDQSTDLVLISDNEWVTKGFSSNTYFANKAITITIPSDAPSPYNLAAATNNNVLFVTGGDTVFTSDLSLELPNINGAIWYIRLDIKFSNPILKLFFTVLNSNSTVQVNPNANVQLYIQGGIISTTPTLSITNVLFSNGNAGNPAIAFANSTNTGIYLTADKQMTFVANGGPVAQVSVAGFKVNANKDTDKNTPIISFIGGVTNADKAGIGVTKDNNGTLGLIANNKLMASLDDTNGLKLPLIPLAVTEGGTGATTLTTNSLVLAQGNNPLTTVTTQPNAVLVTDNNSVITFGTTLPSISLTNPTLTGTVTATNTTINGGTWNGNIISGANGGTGVNNGSSTLSLPNNNNITLTTSATTSLVLPTAGTLVAQSNLTTFQPTLIAFGLFIDSYSVQTGYYFTVGKICYVTLSVGISTINSFIGTSALQIDISNLPPPNLTTSNLNNPLISNAFYANINTSSPHMQGSIPGFRLTNSHIDLLFCPNNGWSPPDYVIVSDCVINSTITPIINITFAYLTQ